MSRPPASASESSRRRLEMYVVCAGTVRRPEGRGARDVLCAVGDGIVWGELGVRCGGGLHA